MKDHACTRLSAALDASAGHAAVPGARALASSVSRFRAWRPQMAQESLLLVVSLYFALVSNAAFWHAVLDGRQLAAAGSWGYALALGVALTTLHFILAGLAANRWLIKPVLGLLIVLAALASFHMRKFGIYVDPDMLRNVLRTDVAEARELLTADMFAYLLVFAGLPLLLLSRVQIRRRSFGRALLVRLGALALAIVLGAGGIGLVFKDFGGQMRNNKEIRYLITPANAVYSLGRALGKEAKAAAPQARAAIGTDAALAPSWQRRSKPVLFVMVVGETVRAANWGLNDRADGRQTTPELAGLDVINFSDVSSCGTNTEVSVPCLFSAQGRRHYDEEAIRGSESMLHVLARAGFRVVWRDNQSGCKGVCDGLEVQRPGDAPDPQLCDGEHCLDEVLLKDAEQLLADTEGNLVLVMHQLGNHGPAYFSRYPERFRRFTPTCDTADLSRCSREQIANSYDNAVLYTDHFLAMTVDFLERQQARFDTAMVYVSDHGESLGENGLFLHGMPYAIAPQEQTRVPLTMWFSDGFARSFGLDTACLRQHAAQPVGHDNLFHSVLGVLDVTTAVRDPSMDLFAACRHG